MLNLRENILNYYNNKPMDRFVTFNEGVQFMIESDFYHERPPYNQNGEDWFGVRWIWDPMLMTYCPDANQKPVLEDITQWREVIKWPDLDAMDWENATKIDHVDERFDRTEHAFIIWLQNGPFERLHELMGFENSLIALLEEPEEVKAFFDRWIEYRCKLLDYICKYYKPDVLQVSDDSGTQLAPFYSLDVWEELMHPYWNAMGEQIRKNGVIPELHSCGHSEQFFARLNDSPYPSLLIQSINNFDYIEDNFKRPIGFVPSDLGAVLTMKSHGGNLTVKDLQNWLDDYIGHRIHRSPAGTLVMVFAPPIPVGDLPEDHVLTEEAEICAYALKYIMDQSDKYTSWIQEGLKKAS